MKKALTVRVPEDLNRRFTEFCRKNGYKKGGLVLSLLERILDYYQPDSALAQTYQAEITGKSSPQEENGPPQLESPQKKETVITSQGPTFRRPERDPLAGIDRLLGKPF